MPAGLPDFAAALPPETRARLIRYADLLTTWTRRINLVAPADLPLLWTRHIDDSLRLIPLIPPNTPRAIDLGSGGGLPGLVLAIVTGIPFDLVELDRRKAAFLREAARQSEAPVTVRDCRIESCALPPAQLLTARALAPLPALLALAAPLLAPGGTLLAPKGARAEAEIEAARASWEFDLRRAGPPTGPILVLSGLRRTEPAHAPV